MINMNYTPYANTTDAELMTVVMNKADATPLEIELMLRLERLHDELEDWHNQPAAKYKEDA